MSDFRFTFCYIVLFLIVEYVSHRQLIFELLDDSISLALASFVFVFVIKLCVLTALIRIKFSTQALSFIFLIGVWGIFPECVELCSYFGIDIRVAGLFLLLPLIMFGSLWEFLLEKKLSEKQLIHGVCFLWGINLALSNPQDWFVI